MILCIRLEVNKFVDFFSVNSFTRPSAVRRKCSTTPCWRLYQFENTFRSVSVAQISSHSNGKHDSQLQKIEKKTLKSNFYPLHEAKERQQQNLFFHFYKLTLD